jgi:hypothetical protein
VWLELSRAVTAAREGRGEAPRASVASEVLAAA